MYIPINNPQGGDENISSFDEAEAGCSIILVSWNIGKVKNKDSTPISDPISRPQFPIFSYIPWISWTETNGMMSKIHVI